MIDIRNVVKFSEEGILSARAISRATGVSKNTVTSIIAKAKTLNIKYSDIKELPDNVLYTMFYPNNTNIKYDRPEPDVDKILKELNDNPSLTIRICWEEYLECHPDGLRYTQFRERIKAHINERNIRMHVERKPGEKIYIDWVGDTGHITDTNTGEIHKVYVFASTIGVSSKVYIEGFLDMKIASYVEGTIHAFNYYGGVSKYLVPDNCKTAVITANKYDPITNSTYQALADYYHMCLMPARSRKPTDKPTVEKAVLDCAERSLAKMRHMTFFSLKEFNETLQNLMEEFNNTPYQKEKEYTRNSKFNEYDKPLLKSLPNKPFELFTQKDYIVGMDSHIEVNKKYYSVPYKYVSKKVKVKIYATYLEIFYDNIKIASHNLLLGNKKYSTDIAHLPERHQNYLTYKKEWFINEGLKIDESVKELIENLFYQHKDIEEQCYRGCLGILSLSKTYGKVKLIKACHAALKDQCYSYRYIKSYIDNDSKKEKETIIYHPNIRGAEHYREVE